MGSKSRFTSAVRVLAGTLAFACGACRGNTDHSADVSALVAHVSRPEPKVVFLPVGASERSPIPTVEPAPYRLGREDVVEVRLLNSPSVAGYESPFVGHVREDGNLHVPLAGAVPALDRTTAEIEADLVPRLEPVVRSPIVDVRVTGFRGRTARVVGEGVEQEQFLPVDGRLTLLGALIQTGATRKPDADREEAYLIRGRAVHPFSLAAIVEQADPAGNVVLQDGDHVFVPARRVRDDFVYVFGQVVHPGRFPMDHHARPFEKGHLTLTGAIGLAGGVLEGSADCDQVCLYRGGCRDLRVFRVGVPDVYRCGESIALEPGDRIYVAPNALAKFNMGLQQFLPFLQGAGTGVGLGLSGAALYQQSK
jgi:polysaccharide export outer membrane protein